MTDSPFFEVLGTSVAFNFRSATRARTIAQQIADTAAIAKKGLNGEAAYHYYLHSAVALTPRTVHCTLRRRDRDRRH